MNGQDHVLALASCRSRKDAETSFEAWKTSRSSNNDSQLTLDRKYIAEQCRSHLEKDTRGFHRLLFWAFVTKRSKKQNVQRTIDGIWIKSFLILFLREIIKNSHVKTPSQWVLSIGRSLKLTVARWLTTHTVETKRLTSFFQLCLMSIRPTCSLPLPRMSDRLRRYVSLLVSGIARTAVN